MVLKLSVDQSNDSIALQLYVELIRSVLGEINITSKSTGVLPSLETDTITLNGASTIARYLARIVATKGDHEQKNVVSRENSLHTAYIYQWVAFSQVDLAGADDVKSHLDLLEQSISSTTYFVGNSISLADIFLYVYLHKYVLSSNFDQKTHFNLARWFNLIQHHAPWSNGTAGAQTEFFTLASIELKPVQSEFKLRQFIEAPKEKAPVAKAEEPKGDAKKEEPKKQAAPQGDKKEAKKEAKKEEAPKKEEVKGDKEPELLNPHLIDIRIGKVLSVEKHSNAESLFVEKIDIGEEKPRTICSGLVGKVEESVINGALVLVMVNLKPGNMRGVTSEGMLMCATDSNSTDEKKKVELLTMPADAKIGDKIEFDGFPKVEAEKQLNPKRFAKMIGNFHTDDQGRVTYAGKVLKIVGSGSSPSSNFKNSEVK